MALKPCRECGEKVSTHAKACPKCGVAKPVRQPMSVSQAILAIGLLLVICALAVKKPDEISPNEKPTGESPTVQTTAANAVLSDDELARKNLADCYARNLPSNFVRETGVANHDFSYLNPPAKECKSEIDGFYDACRKNGETQEKCGFDYASLWVVVNDHNDHVTAALATKLNRYVNGLGPMP